MDWNTVLLGVSMIATGLMSGLWYGWVVSVIPGTRRVSDATYVDIMQRINRAILNPAFLVAFMGIPVLLVVAAILQFRAGDARRGWLVGSAAVVYAIGVFGVTASRNVPLNDDLDAFDLEAADPSAVQVRRQTYEDPWNRWHYVRTVANLAAFVLVSTAALVAAEAD